MNKIKELRKPHFYVAALAILLLLLPSGLRYLFFYRGVIGREKTDILLPAYSELETERPEISPLPKSNHPVTPSHAEVLFDISHGNLYEISELDSLTSRINHRGGHLNVTDYYGDLETELQKADAFVVIAPTMSFSEWERRAITRFVARGGRLLVIADPTRSMSDDFLMLEDFGSSLGNIEVSNLLLEPFGIAFSKGYMYNLVKNEGNFRNVYFTILHEDQISEGLSQVVFYGLHEIKTAPKPLIVGDGNTLSSSTDLGSGLIAAATDAEGRVLALTDLNFMIPPYHQVADNAILIDNIAEFLSGAARERSLADFPHIFTRPVTLLVDSERALNTEMLATITAAQHSLEALGLDLTIASLPTPGQDLAAFGVFPPDEALLPLLKPFGLVFSGFEDRGEFEETEAAQIDDEPRAEPEEPAVQLPETLEELLAMNRAELEALQFIGPDGIDIILSMDEAEKQDLLSLSEDEQAIVMEMLLGEYQTYLAEEGNNASDKTHENNGETVTVPGFGKINTNGVGLILYHDNKEQNRVILLADTQENLKILSSAFYGGDLNNCAMQGQIAVCVLDESASEFYWEDGFWEDDFEEYNELEENPEAVG
ncbi:MAG: hypothetical protein RBT34_02960 [Anaerolineaceae bacterium]|jgi:hypothetical protein|nr:hypothetical protein [Anaerolineaceae bacterium]